MRQKSTAKLKKELDAIFSKYIRKKSASNGWTACITCGSLDEWKHHQCGHFVSRNHLATRWDEENCAVQCAGCNVWGHGKLSIFADWLVKKYGPEIISRLEKKRRAFVKLSRSDYEEKIAYYKQKFEAL